MCATPGGWAGFRISSCSSCPRRCGGGRPGIRAPRTPCIRISTYCSTSRRTWWPSSAPTISIAWTSARCWRSIRRSGQTSPSPPCPFRSSGPAGSGSWSQNRTGGWSASKRNRHLRPRCPATPPGPWPRWATTCSPARRSSMRCWRMPGGAPTMTLAARSCPNSSPTPASTPITFWRTRFRAYNHMKRSDTGVTSGRSRPTGRRTWICSAALPNSIWPTRSGPFTPRRTAGRRRA